MTRNAEMNWDDYCVCLIFCRTRLVVLQIQICVSTQRAHQQRGAWHTDLHAPVPNGCGSHLCPQVFRSNRALHLSKRLTSCQKVCRHEIWFSQIWNEINHTRGEKSRTPLWMDLFLQSDLCRTFMWVLFTMLAISNVIREFWGEPFRSLSLFAPYDCW